MVKFTYNFPRIIKQLDIEEGINQAEEAEKLGLAWLEDSYRNVQHFWNELFNNFSSRSQPRGKSSPFEGYDFYHDMVIRNRKEGRVAFSWYSGELGWQKLTYEDLHVRCSFKMNQWMSQGVEAGQTICLVLPLGVEFLICLVTALRMGVLPSILPPSGDQFILERLEKISPKFIATEELYTLILSDYEDILLLSDLPSGEVDSNLPSYTYPAKQPAAMLLSPSSATPEIPLEVLSDHLYLRALRDGMLLFDLKPGDNFAVPGGHPLVYQPCTLISTLFCGATYVHVELEDLQENPKLLEEIPNLTLGLNGELLELYLKEEPSVLQNLKQWFRSPAEPTNWDKWQLFLTRVGQEKIPFTSVLMEGAFGGSILFSLRRKKFLSLNVLPSPGVDWMLADTNRSGQEALGGFGLYSVQAEEGPEFPGGFIILARHHKQWFYGGTLEPKRRGMTYPINEVRKALSKLPFLKQCTILSMPSNEGTNFFLFLLLAFVGPGLEEEISKKKQKWTGEIHSAIATHLAQEFLPDLIQFYPFYGRELEEAEGGAVNIEWCRAQYFTGGLHRKSRMDLYRILNRLRYLCIMEKE